MKGSSGLGYGNQHSKGKGVPMIGEIVGGIMGKKEEASPAPYASPAKTKDGVDFNDPNVRANYEKYKNNPDYKKALAKKQGGKTTYNAKENTSTTEKS
mgnify:CR=1 FL=1